MMHEVDAGNLAFLRPLIEHPVLRSRLAGTRLWPLREPDAVDALRGALGLPPLDADAVAAAWTADEVARFRAT